MAEREGLVRLGLIASDHLRCPISSRVRSFRRTNSHPLLRLRRIVCWAAPNGGEGGIGEARPHRKRSPSVPHLQSRSLLSSNKFSSLAPATPDSVLGCAQWRRGRDSNPRWSYPHTSFPGMHNRPLCHLSFGKMWSKFSTACRSIYKFISFEPL